MRVFLFFIALYFHASHGLAQSQDPVKIKADELSYEESTKILNAIGKVEVKQNENIVRADKIIWNKEKDTISAEGNFQLQVPGHITLYADKAELENKMRAGSFQYINATLDNQAHIRAKTAHRDINGKVSFTDARYTACNTKCEDSGKYKKPIWQLRASKLTHNPEKQMVFYRNARIEFFGIPTLYIPYFAHPSPEVKKKSGWLIPDINNDSDLGFNIALPYFFNLAPNYDLIYTPRFTENVGFIHGLRWRHLTRNGHYWLDAHGTWPKQGKKQFDVDKNFRGNIEGKGNFQFGEHLQYGFALDLISDDSFLRRFDIGSRNELESNAYIRHYYDRFSIYGRLIHFRSTLSSINDKQTPLIAPYIISHYRPDKDFFGGQIEINTSALGLHRDIGTSTERISSSVDWHRDLQTRNGQFYKFFTQLRLDKYWSRNVIDTKDPALTYERSIQSRFLGLAGAQWRMPFVKHKKKSFYILEPIGQLIISPNHMNEGKIPNEDSRSVEFGVDNLFSINRFPGIDRWEDGTRFNLGINWSIYSPKGRHSHIRIGQSFRLRDTELFTSGTGLSNKTSDYVFSITIQPSNFLYLHQELRARNETLEIVRNESSLYYSYKDKINLHLGYLFLDSKISGDLEERQEIRAGMFYQMNSNWAVSGNIRYDSHRNQRIRNSIGVEYQDECITAQLIFSQNFVQDRGIEASNSLKLRLVLATLGGQPNIRDNFRQYREQIWQE
ncbi:MAG: LPS-assembly protein LptD [Parvibaculales bacterium]